MKQYILLFVLLIESIYGFGQVDSIRSNNEANSKITFIRNTGFTGSARQFKVFIDNELICKLDNDKYLIHDIQPGIHYIAAQLDGTTLKNKTEKVEMNIKPGVNYYVQVIIQENGMWSDTQCLEITESFAKQVLKKVTQDLDCK